MHSALKKTEKFIDMSIPYMLAVLLTITAVDFFFEEIAIKYSHAIDIIDNIIILFFLADLAFKYMRSKNIPQFVRANWIDIIAVIPFYMIFRIAEEFAFMSEMLKSGKDTVEIGASVEKESSIALKELREAKLAMRSEKMLRYIKIAARIPRLAKAVHFFERPR